MKKIITIACFLISVHYSHGQDIIQLKISKPYCVFNFLESATNQRGTSSTLRNFITEKTKGDSDFNKICADFKEIKLDYTYRREEFPKNRRQNRSTKDLINIALVNAKSLEEFQRNSIGILPNSEHQKLILALEKAYPYFDKIMWEDSEDKLINQQKELDSYVFEASSVFKSFKQFYNSSWTANTPFIVALYPIPGRNGNSTATPHANSLCVGVMVDETAHAERMGVILHEMCHVLYDEQTNEFQHEIEKWFDENTSPFKQFAYNFFDEALATALGNGWAYQKLTGTLDSNEWYNNEYINGFAKALYPLVSDYIIKNQQMDKAFIDSAVTIFAERFPRSIADYGILLNRVSIYCDTETNQDMDDLMNKIGEKFQLTNISLSSPIKDEMSLEMLSNGSQNQLVIIDKNHQENFKALKNIFPALSKMKLKKLEPNTLLSFYDEANRPIIVLVSKENGGIPVLVDKMESLKYFNLNKIIQPL